MSVAPRQTSALAVVSLVMGIASWTVLPFVASIVAIITGHMARAEIRRRPHELEGDGLAVTGLVLGWVMVGAALAAIVVFILFFGGLAGLECPCHAGLHDLATTANGFSLFNLERRGAGVTDREEQLRALVHAGSAVAPGHQNRASLDWVCREIRITWLKFSRRSRHHA